jgi:hypothetical protein
VCASVIEECTCATSESGVQLSCPRVYSCAIECATSLSSVPQVDRDIKKFSV